MTNIRDIERTLTTHTNGGTQKSTKVADTRFFGQVWLNPDSMTNIFFLTDVCKYANVPMDSRV